RRTTVAPNTVFLRDQGWIDDPAKDTWGELAASFDDHMFLTPGDDVYVTIEGDHDVKVGADLTVFRPLRPHEGGQLVSVIGTVRVRKWDPDNKVVQASVVEAYDGQPAVAGRNIIVNGFAELQKVWHILKGMPRLKRFLLAFFLYSMGVQTVMLAATIFGSKELKLQTAQLIAVILIIQLVAIVGAWGMARLSDLWGNLNVLLLVVLIWIGVCIAAYFITDANGFYAVAAVVGLVMGGIQSLSRSTYSRLMPETHDTASFFSFYDVTEKVAIVLGMVTFGFVDALMNMRSAILALIVFFVLGALALVYARQAKG
ncbi:MAG: MFS transporter, partial [Chitinophagia bacterium]|nr:MFS transporter [Chitinophagia bacterium]